jgi:prepilin-type N-terminal cleavage/methylation domain-containing protein
MPKAGRRSAFTLVEVIVALAVILILAAVAVPQLGGYLDQKRVEETAALLAQLRDALFGPATSFRAEVGANASRLSHLSTPIVNGDDDSCGSNYSNGERGNWPDGGPYINWIIDPAAGLRTPIGQAQDLLERVPVNGGGSTGRLRIRFPNTVTLVDAQALDVYVDGVQNGTSGVVHWAQQPGTDMANVYYDVLIDGTC